MIKTDTLDGTVINNSPTFINITSGTQYNHYINDETIEQNILIVTSDNTYEGDMYWNQLVLYLNISLSNYLLDGAIIDIYIPKNNACNLKSNWSIMINGWNAQKDYNTIGLFNNSSINIDTGMFKLIVDSTNQKIHLMNINGCLAINNF